LIKPFIFKEHYYWSNFVIDGKQNAFRGHLVGVEEQQGIKGFDLSNYKGIDKKKILRNCVEPESGRYIFNLAFKEPQRTLQC